MELAGLSRDPDPTLVRRSYDPSHVEAFAVITLAREIAKADAGKCRDQYSKLC
jgi:hypothetical protein